MLFGLAVLGSPIPGRDLPDGQIQRCLRTTNVEYGFVADDANVNAELFE